MYKNKTEKEKGYTVIKILVSGFLLQRFGNIFHLEKIIFSFLKVVSFVYLLKHNIFKIILIKNI